MKGSRLKDEGRIATGLINGKLSKRGIEWTNIQISPCPQLTFFIVDIKLQTLNIGFSLSPVQLRLTFYPGLIVSDRARIMISGHQRAEIRPGLPLVSSKSRRLSWICSKKVFRGAFHCPELSLRSTRKEVWYDSIKFLHCQTDSRNFSEEYDSSFWLRRSPFRGKFALSSL